MNDDGSYRPQSVAFKDNHSHELSIHLAELTTKENALAKYPADSLVAIRARQVRTLKLAIVRDPTADDPSHALVCPAPNRKAARTLAMNFEEWVELKPPR